MPARNEAARARARLELETPISADADLLKLQEQVTGLVREATHRGSSGDDKLVSMVMDAVASFYLRHAILKKRRRARDVNGPPFEIRKP